MSDGVLVVEAPTTPLPSLVEVMAALNEGAIRVPMSEVKELSEQDRLDLRRWLAEEREAA